MNICCRLCLNTATIQAMGKHINSRGFTMVEITVVIVVLGILAGIVYTVGMPRWRERTYYLRATGEMNAMGNAMVLYASKYNDFPADVNRNIPAGIKEFLQGQNLGDGWPDAPWPGSVYDYDNWDVSGDKIYQISVRFCTAGDTATCKKNFPKEPWVTSSWDSYSAVYYCIKGKCRSHEDKPINHPGYCINCGTGQKYY